MATGGGASSGVAASSRVAGAVGGVEGGGACGGAEGDLAGGDGAAERGDSGADGGCEPARGLKRELAGDDLDERGGGEPGIGAAACGDDGDVRRRAEEPA